MDREPRQSRDEGSARHPALAQVLALCALGAFGLAAVAVAWLISDFGFDGEALGRAIDASGSWGPLVVIALMVLHCFVPFPAEFLALSAGAAFGTAKGTALVWTGAMIGALLSFGIARALGRRAAERLLPRRHRAALHAWTADHGAAALLVSRFVPVIAFNLINYAAGLSPVRWWTFVWTTAIGILPLTLLMVYLGARMAELSWPLVIAVSAAAIIAFVVLHRLRRRRGRPGR